MKNGSKTPENSKAADRESLFIPEGRQKAILCARLVAELHAVDPILLDVSDFSSFTDFFLICSGKSSRQVQGIAENLETSLNELAIKPLGVEGRGEGHWILMDYSDLIIHIFYDPVRSFYDLESLWSEAKKVEWAVDFEPSGPVDNERLA